MAHLRIRIGACVCGNLNGNSIKSVYPFEKNGNVLVHIMNAFKLWLHNMGAGGHSTINFDIQIIVKSNINLVPISNHQRWIKLSHPRKDPTNFILAHFNFFIFSTLIIYRISCKVSSVIFPVRSCFLHFKRRFSF